MRVIHEFHGGIHPPERKALSRPGALQEAAAPPLLVVPLTQSSGEPATPIVTVGDRVRRGQLLATAQGDLSANIHAPTSGIITAIESRPVPHPSGLEDRCIVLEADGADEWTELTPMPDWRGVEPGTLIDAIKAAGIVGLGGAGFPTATKLIAGSRREIHTLLINGTECEPYITADDTLMQRRPEAILEGAEILAHAVSATTLLIGIEDNKPEAIAAMQQAAERYSGPCEVEVVSFPTLYPSGGEKQLIEILTGEQVPRGGYPADLGIVCQNPGTAVAVRDAVLEGKPLTERIVTLTGEALREPQNVLARLGTPIEWLLERAGYTAADEQGNDARLIHGGPMMGFALSTPAVPVIKTTNCVLAPTAEELPPAPPAQPCIRCGHCAEACPASLLPQQLYWYARSKDNEQLEQHGLFDCIECGACAYVCPSHIPLVQYYRAAKDSLREAAAEKQRAEQAKARFEARQARVERETAEREAKRAARRAAAQAKADSAGEDPVQAAIARAKARKTAGADSADPVQAAIARSAAKRAQAARADENDPIKAAVARAAAKRAGLTANKAADDASRANTDPSDNSEERSP
ncbi:MAG: electron transport complex subunit RsxC [Halieaceae bacterium]|jgi:electron transport complex protein RnfC|nr:electron transport complex subunit RsxC [Halieaceae bacterium]